MTLPGSGAISLGMVADELGIGLPLSLGDNRVRALAGNVLGQISMTGLYGKSAYIPMTLAVSNGSGGPASSDNSGGSVNGTAAVTVMGGSGGFTYQWTIASNSNSASVGALNGSAVSASKTFIKLANGSATVELSVAVTDNTGHTVTGTARIELYWGSSV